jgi:O-6-methylguanine DNA methyltransferase
MFSAEIDTPIGVIYALSDHKALHYLGFERQNGPIGKTNPLDQIRIELEAYFRGELKQFHTPIHFDGSPFQNGVWQSLMNIPFGETRSYQEIAKMIKNPKASRAVGNANGANPFIIIVPCHRVIASDGTIGGYSAGLEKKYWLLRHEMNLQTRTDPFFSRFSTLTNSP